MSTKNFCDACEAELTKKWFSWIVLPGSSFGTELGKYDLCQYCDKRFRNVINEFFVSVKK